MADRLEDLVERLIGLSVPGDAGSRNLPPERELCAALDVSRGTLREQLATLESLGILRRRQGQGTSIDTPDASFLRTYFTLMRSLGYLSEEQVAGAREMLEQTIAAEAARHVTDADLAELRTLVGDIVTQSIAGNDDAALEADFAFHSRLYAIVDNPIFTMLNAGLSHVLHENVRVRRDFAARRDAKNPDGSINTDNVHSEIVDALATRSPDRARAAMRKHFAEYSALTVADLTAAPSEPSRLSPASGEEQ
ncbi:pyruvate dehydrogenase complex transcriptional repressor PdhR [Parafrigoribacterium mesophilum]|uniref:FadR/GntR family transcriptional regulator n=1 Tax=Parafrigoribacterium mesophilum TaxID=433646 RepID=UPI0031FD2EA6